jgi:hypothetical protein
MANTPTANLNIQKPGAGDINWDDEYFGMADAVDQIGNLLCMTVNALFVPEAGQVFYEGFVPAEDITLKAIGLFAMQAPTGADLTVDVLKDGVAEANIATLPATATFQKTTFATPIEILKTERLGLKFVQVGSTQPGNGIIATLYFMKKALP